MKFRISLYLTFLCSALLAEAQIKGQILDYDVSRSIPIKSATIVGTTISSQSNFDGYFSLDIPVSRNSVDVMLESYEGVLVVVSDIEVMNKAEIDIGKIGIPIFSIIDVKEYENLNEKQKLNCKPMYHYGDLVGYQFKEKLEVDYLLILCGTNDTRVDNIEYNSSNFILNVNWIDLDICK